MSDHGSSSARSDSAAKSSVEGSAETFERRIQWLPSHADLPLGPRSGGIGEMRIRFLLIGPKGAIQWMIGTGWYVRAARDHLSRFSTTQRDVQRAPTGWDLGYHAYEPRYEGQSDMGECDVLCGAKCFYDGSGLQAELLIEGFLAKGEDYLWPTLEAVYRHNFEEAPWPFSDDPSPPDTAGPSAATDRTS